MADEAVIESPQASEPEIPAGIEGAMKAFEEQVAPKPAAAPKKETTEKVTETTVKPTEVKVDPKVDPKVKTPKVDDPWEKADPKLKGEHFKTVRTLQDKVDSYEKRIKEIESKKVETPADTKLVEQYQNQIKEMEQKIAASDYRQSQDFQKQFVAKWKSEYNATVGEVKQLMLTQTDAEGNQTQRAATEADFQKIMRLPPGEQDKVIHDLFGHYAPRVFSRLMRLQEIERASEEALNDHAQNAEKTAKEKALATQKSDSEYKQHYDACVASLEKGWPQYFKADESDQESTTALAEGYKFVDEALASFGTMTQAERAAANAVIRARAGGLGVAVVKLNRALAENESLKTELSKYRKSDPGSAQDRTVTTSVDEDDVPKGIEAATKAFANLR